jgi:serine/threonine protein kinase
VVYGYIFVLVRRPLQDSASSGFEGRSTASTDKALQHVVDLRAPYSCCFAVLQEGQLPILTVLRIARDVAVGMDYMHKINIIHRDLRAANLLLDDETKRVKIGDLGFARLMDKYQKMSGGTGTHRRV